MTLYRTVLSREINMKRPLNRPVEHRRIYSEVLPRSEVKPISHSSARLIRSISICTFSRTREAGALVGKQTIGI
jgi:hypothetical protein